MSTFGPTCTHMHMCVHTYEPIHMHGCVHAHAYKRVVSSTHILLFCGRNNVSIQGYKGKEEETWHNEQALLVTCDLSLCFMCCWMQYSGMGNFRLSLSSFHSFVHFIYLDLSAPLLLRGEAEWTNGHSGLTAALGLMYTRRHLSISVVCLRSFRQQHVGTEWGKCSFYSYRY